MKVEVFRDLSLDELGTRVQELREQMLKLRFQNSTGQIENPQMLSSLRRDIARALTVLRERHVAEVDGPGVGEVEAAD
ncbi:MAG: 50S ribosomal protein L29 [Acidobacteriota bacterium]